MSNDLVRFHDDHATTTSLLVAEKFGKHHRNVVRDIEKLECSEQFSLLNFEQRKFTYTTGKGQVREAVCYEMTRDGFAFLAMGFTGKEAAFWKEQFIAAFNALEAEVLARRQSDLDYEARFRAQAEKHWFSKYPHWAVIHERVSIFSWEPARIAQYIGRSISSVRRAIHRMIHVGILDPRVITLGMRQTALARSLIRSGIADFWGRRVEQLDLFEGTWHEVRSARR